MLISRAWHESSLLVSHVFEKPSAITKYYFYIFSDLYLSEKVPVIDKAPSALTFHRGWVTSNRPVIIKNAVTKWPALEKWNLNYLR